VPTTEAERRQLLDGLGRTRQQLAGLREFIIQGDTSPKVRTWLVEAEQEETRLERDLARIEAQEKRRPLQVHPARVAPYLDDVRAVLQKGGGRARQLLQSDIKTIKIHAVTDGPKPFARAEVISTGKGLLDRVVLMVAGARFELWTRPLMLAFLITY
jgi:hypothetical protein